MLLPYCLARYAILLAMPLSLIRHFHAADIDCQLFSPLAMPLFSAPYFDAAERHYAIAATPR